MKYSGFLDRAGNLFVRDGKKNWPTILVVYFLILLPVLMPAAYSSWRSHQEVTRSVRSQRLDLAHLTAATVREKLHRLIELSVSLASHVRFRQLVSQGKWEEAMQVLGNVPADFPYVDRLFLADLQGTLMADFPTVPEVRKQNFASRDWFQGIRRNWQPYISEVYQREAEPRAQVVAAAVPVKLGDGPAMGILVLQVKLDSMLAWIKEIDAGPAGLVFVVDQRGRLVARPGLDPQSGIPDLSAKPVVQKALRGDRGIEILSDDQSDGEEQLAAYAPVADYGWGVVVQQPVRAAYAARDRGLLLALGTYGVVFVLNCALAYFLLTILIRVKKAEESSSHLAAIVESSDDAIVSKTLDGKIITWNQGAERIYGYNEREVQGRSIDFLVPAEHTGEFDVILQRIQRGETIDRYETVCRRKDGGTIDVSLTVSPICDTQGKIVATSTISRDITHQKQLRREIQEKNRVLEEQYKTVREANRLKSEFLANMSHELRTPLNAIIGYAQLMHDGRVGPLSAEQQEYLGDILNSGRRLLELINDVLDLARVESGNMDFKPEPVELSQLVDQVRMIVKSIAAGKRLSIEAQVAPEVERLVIDPAKLKQVLYHYLSNAIKFTADGGRITIRARPEDDEHFRLEVADSGVGISPSQIGELFVEFKQLEAGLSKKHQGTGLGLALTKKIVEAQGGRVGVRSTPGQGSLFYAVLPKHMPYADAQASTAEPRSSHARGPRVLVVEDDPHDLHWLHQTLSQAGYLVDAATTGAEAVAKARAHAYSAVLLDLILPDALGWDILKAIRSEEKNRNAPVIAVTVVTEKAAAKSFALQDYLPKPVSTAALISSLRRAGIIANGAGKMIMVVDDDADTLKLAAAALESSGYRASCHDSGASALAAAAQLGADAVVLDLLMPDMDGFEFLDRLRNLPNNQNTPVIVWTAKEDITPAEREKLKIAAHSIALKGYGGIDAVLRELRYHIEPDITGATREDA